MSTPFSRKHLSIEGLLREARRVFARIPDVPGNEITLVDHLMSGLAVFGLKYPSLLQFERDRREATTTRANLKALYGVERAPSDTRFRERLDALEPSQLRPLYTRLFGQLQRGKGLEGFEYLDGHYLLSLDGTGYFSSQKVHCAPCAEKHHRDGTTTYYHQMLGAVLVHPQCKEVFPLAPEPILRADGAKKNDGERNAAKRLLSDLRREHPHLKLIVIEDALASNAPHIRHLQALDLRFILGAKESDHTFLFEWVAATAQTAEATLTDQEGFRHRFRYLNGAPLNEANFELEVNFLEYWEHAPDGSVTHFAWVTDIPINDSNRMTLMRGARARWKIENETFNTLKNQGDHFEHHFGHGHQHLSTVLRHLMMLAFLIDQIQQRGCRLFQAAWRAVHSKRRLWQKLRSRFDLCLIPDWETLYRSIIAPPAIPLGAPACGRQGHLLAVGRDRPCSKCVLRETASQLSHRRPAARGRRVRTGLKLPNGGLARMRTWRAGIAGRRC